MSLVRVMSLEEPISGDDVIRKIREEAELAEKLIAVACELRAQIAHLAEQLRMRQMQTARALQQSKIKPGQA